MNTKRLLTCAAVIAASTFGATNAQDSEADNAMSFFITSVGSGDGANLGGLAGADAHCQNLAQAAGSRGKTWRAYLSAHATEEMAAIEGVLHARRTDPRIGEWLSVVVTGGEVEAHRFE